MIRHICMHDTPYINDDKPYMNDDKPLVYNRTIYRTVYARWYTRYVCMIRHILTMIYQICMHITNMYDTTFHGVICSSRVNIQRHSPLLVICLHMGQDERNISLAQRRRESSHIFIRWQGVMVSNLSKFNPFKVAPGIVKMDIHLTILGKKLGVH